MYLWLKSVCNPVLPRVCIPSDSHCRKSSCFSCLEQNPVVHLPVRMWFLALDCSESELWRFIPTAFLYFYILNWMYVPEELPAVNLVLLLLVLFSLGWEIDLDLFFFFFFSQDMVSLCSFGYSRTQSVYQAGLELEIPPTSFPACWD